jgi:cholesterol oxidase
MRGFHTPGAFAYDAGYITGRRDWNRLAFELTIGSDDVGAALSDPEHVMTATGYVRCKALSAADMPVHDGTFNLFSPGSSRDRRLMRYRLPINTPEGPMTLLGVKNVGNDPGFDSWSDTTTLYTRIARGDADFDAPISADYSRGILRLNLPMFAHQLLTFRGTPAGIARFGAFFAGQLLRTYAHGPRPEVPR